MSKSSFEGLPETIKFVKMHGNGNDFVVISELKELLIPEELKPAFVKSVCHRRFGVGADGCIFVQKSEKADVKFRYFNSDGGEAEMCGNGIRCFSRFVIEEEYGRHSEKIRVETLAGIKELSVRVKDGTYWVKVDMGKPAFDSDMIPAVKTENENKSVNEIWNKKFTIKGDIFKVYALNTGVPHAIIFVDDINIRIIEIARNIRYNEVFPQGINVNFVKVISKKELAIRTYERGVEDETLSCGTGSVASAVVASILGLTLRSEPVKVLTNGGLLKIEIDFEQESGAGLFKTSKPDIRTVYMTGSANRVFNGKLLSTELRYILPEYE